MSLFNKLKKTTKRVAVGLGIAEPSMLDQAKKGASDVFQEARKVAKGALKEAKEEFGMPSSLGEKIEEAALSAAESVGLKDPRIGKSLLGVIKSAFGMIAAITGPESKQEAALEQFDKACATFSKAISGLFKKKGIAHESGSSKKAGGTPKKTVQAKPKPQTKWAAKSADKNKASPRHHSI